MPTHDPVECTQVQNIQHLTDAITGEDGLVVKVTLMLDQLKTIKEDTSKIRHTLYGNGEPGVCENIRYCMTWIKRINWAFAAFFTGAVTMFYWIIQQIIKPMVDK